MRVYMGVGVRVCVWMRVFKLSQARNLKRLLERKWVTNVYTFVSLTVAQIIIAASRREWVMIWFVNVYDG